MLRLVQPGPAQLGGWQADVEVGEARGADQSVSHPHAEHHRSPLTLLGQRVAIPVRAQRPVHVNQLCTVAFCQRDEFRDIRLHQRLQAQRTTLQGYRARGKHDILL